MPDCHPYGCVTVPSTPGVPTTLVVASDREQRPAFDPDLASTGFSSLYLILTIAVFAIVVGVLAMAGRRLVLQRLQVSDT
jgi:hypothetical protein